MTRRPIAYALALAGTTTSLGALWPSQTQLADLRLRAAGTPEERVRALEARRALAPGDRALALRLADGYAQAGRPDAGLALLEGEAARRELTREELAAGRRLALAIGQPKRALALHLGPHARRRSGELKSLVDLALASGDPAAALRLQRELAASQPGDPAVTSRMRDLALMAEDLPAAIAAQEELLAAARTPAAAERLASLRLQANDVAGALAALECVPSKDPAWHHRAAQLAEWSGQPARAVPHLRALFAASPQPALGRRLIATLSKAGDARAVDFGVELAARFPADGALRRDAADRLVGAGRGPEAIDLMNRAVAERPDDVGAHDDLVDFALGRGLLDGAVVELGRWVARRPRDMVALHRLAEVLGWQGRAQEACAVYERLFATCRPPEALARSWRKAWAALAQAKVPPPAPPDVADEAYAAARGGKWLEAGLLFKVLAKRQPRDPARWADLTTALEASGDADGAAKAWRQRLALGGASVADQARYVRLLERASREQEALAVFAAQPWSRLGPDVLAEGAALARAQGDRALEERALRALIMRNGTDVAVRLRLVELLDRRGARAEADLQANAAAGLAPADASVLVALAGRAIYAGRPADDLVERLSRLPDLPATAYALLADAFERRDPARAAAALDAWHGLTGGTAASWLRRGDLASRRKEGGTAHLSWERALELAASPTELRAWTLERLARVPEAMAEWAAVAAAHPDSLPAALALGRHHLDQGDLAAVRRPLTRALAIAPQDPAVRRLQADWLARSGRPVEALQVARALPRDAGVLALEAQLNHDLGRLRQASRTAEQAANLDPALQAALRPLRQAAATRPRAFARLEHLGGQDRQDLGADATMLLGENARGRVAVHHEVFGGVASDEVDLGLSQPLGGATLEGQLGLGGRRDNLQPLGRVGVRWANGGVSVGEERWTEAPQAAARGGRERAVRADLAWQPTPNLDLSAGAGLGRLALDGVEAGTSTSAHAEVAVRPTAAPVTLAYQFGHRGWGAAASQVGLPAAVDVHGVLARYDATVGPLRLSLAPGYALDAATLAGAPTVNGSLAWAPSPEAEVALSGAFAGRSFDLGLGDAYRLVELAARLSF